MLAPAADAIRLSLHVLAATIWVGGQYTLAGLVPELRRRAPEVLRPAARRFAALAWPAFAVLVLTGFWNVAAVHPQRQSNAWQIVLWAKVGVVAVSGLSAWGHQQASRPARLALFGALSSLSAVVALVMGVLLAG